MISITEPYYNETLQWDKLYYNIILQRYKPTVEIITSDLSTGLELGRTAWSGPGTLTLSTIRGAAANNIHKRASTSYPSPLTSHYHSPLRISQGVPDEDVELITVPVQHRPESQQYDPPAEVMGRLCRSQADCSAAYRAVCAVSQHCQVGVTSLLSPLVSMTKLSSSLPGACWLLCQSDLSVSCPPL